MSGPPRPRDIGPNRPKVKLLAENASYRRENAELHTETAYQRDEIARLKAIIADLLRDDAR